MKKERLKLVSAMLLLSGFSTGYVQAAPHAAAVEMHSVQQDNACTGVVVDQNGETVIGASVVVKGTTNGTITGLDGDFSIPNVKKGDVIVVSYVGYMNSEIIWEGKPLKIALKEDSKTLDEVVVVGYATVKKANLTGAVSAVDDKVLADRPIVNLGQGLQGTIPNLNITTSGQPGKGSSFNVRGETSINGGSPLVLVDGV
ncbi:carboxypeptidase-like regulatory domain-containing protein, partial [Phocaeicola vulgatus]